MFVCLCHGITDTAIRHAAEQGITTMSELKRELKVATQCGSCAHHAAAVLKQACAEQAAQADFYPAA